MSDYNGEHNGIAEGTEIPANGAESPPPDDTRATEGAESPTGGEEGVGKVIPLPADKTATKGAQGVYVHRFKKPFEYAGKKYDTINFYFNRMKGTDMLAVEDEMQDNNEYAIAPEISRKFQCKLAARAAGIGSDVIESLPLPDFNKITNEARSFLIDTGY